MRQSIRCVYTYCLLAQPSAQTNIGGSQLNAEAKEIDSASLCTTKQMQIFEFKLALAVDVLSQQNRISSVPAFNTAAQCVALERKASDLQKSSSGETEKSLRRQLKCWRKLITEAAEVPKESQLQLTPTSQALPLYDFWQSKRLLILRDHTALSSVGALWYRAWRLGILNSTNVDAFAKQVKTGLEDPAFHCKSHWLQAFDKRHEVLSQSLWKRYAELLMAMQSLGSEKVNKTFAIASALPDNKQRWRTPQALHAQLPGLRASPLWDKGAFPWLLRLEERFSDVQSEILKAIRTTGFVGNPDKFLHDKADDWQSLALYLDGQWNAKVCKHLTPVTCGLLQKREEFHSNRYRLPDIVSQAAAKRNFEFKKPSTMVKVYVLQPGAYLRPHFGSHGRLAAHLGIAVPEGCCTLTVGGQQNVWEEGKILLFDDAFVHEARNTGTDPRIVLGIFFVHPDLTRSGAPTMEL